MSAHLRIDIVDPDPDYCGLEVSAHNDRFAGSARIYAQLDDLKNLADTIRAFPLDSTDERTFSMGTPDEAFAGGYCSLRFYCKDGAGHVAVDAVFLDDSRFHSRGKAEFSLESIEASQIDSFVDQLQKISQAEAGYATIQTQ